MFARSLPQQCPRKAIQTTQSSLSCSRLASAQSRNVSSSPYGRTHVWKHRAPKLPNPIVPIFPQQVFLSDGSTFTHYTTSPRSKIRLNRDLTNNPLWNYGLTRGMFEDEEGSAGRMGRFRRKFEELSEGSSMDWIVDESEFAIPEKGIPDKEITKTKPKGKKK
ncbi:hypothetical protein M422DRAFT_199506 [Sphaerobolus stellatus SS14]|nr:hypothetical protein M422DRAFT_199506 [Sphaerobolus stellatus SS14]